jgi:formate hydrogenlyase transcriptional activator
MHASSALGPFLELEERNRTLLEINNAIVTSLQRDELLHAICEALKPVLPFDRAAINIYEPETDTLRLFALETGHKSQFVVGSTLDRKDSASGWVFEHQRPLLRRDLEREAQYEAERLAISEGIRSLCIVPLAFHGNRLGTLIVLSKNIGQYTDADADFLHDVANQIALAIENMKSCEETAALNTRVRLILDSAAEGIFGCEPDGTCTFCNEAAAGLLGYDHPAELLGKNMHATEHHSRPDGSPYPLEECPIYRGFRENQGIHRDDEVFWRKDGASFPVEYWSHPMVRDGKTLGAVVTFVDITERRQAEEALRKSEEFKGRLVDCSQDCIKVLDVDGRLLSMNENGMRALEICDFGAVVNSSWIEFWEGNDREAARVAVRAASEGGTGRFIGYFATAIRRQPKWFDVVITPICDAQGKPERLLVVSRDVTENQLNEKALREAHLRLARSEGRSRSLLEINNAIITSLTQGALLRSIAKALRRVVAFDASALTLYLPERDTFRFLAVEGTVGSFRVGQEIQHKDTSVGWVFDQRRPCLRRDLEKEQQYSNERLLAAEGMRSHCVVPLMARGCCIGTLNVSSRNTDQYCGEDADFLREVAAQVGLAVENMKAYEEIQTLKTKLEAENVYLQEEIRTEHNFEEIVGSSAALMDVLQKVELVAPTDTTVLLSGETGTGKELIARAIHARSSRKARAMVSVNCGAIPSSLVESELFGHVKGAFTGALERATGRFELADGSTLFLDEVGELPLDTQVKLLRALQEREFQPVGSSRTVRVDVRIIAASNRDLEQAVRAGGFRADLFYRLNVLPMRVPPLRERQSDIPQLATFFLGRCCKRLGKKITAFCEETMELLVRYDWPGNIRELQNIIERGVVLSRGPVFALDRDVFRMPAGSGTSNTVVDGHDVHKSTTPGRIVPPAQGEEPPLRLADAERQHILSVLERTGWVIDGPKGAAKILDLHPNTLRGRVKRLGIDRIRH